MDQEQADAGTPSDWVGLVGRRIDRAIAELRADPNAAKELQVIRLRAMAAALEGLGLDELDRTLATIRMTRAGLARQEADALRAAVARVRGRVAERTWEAFRLTALDGLSGAEAAARLGVAVMSVFKSRSNVQKMLQEEVRWLEQAD